MNIINFVVIGFQAWITFLVGTVLFDFIHYFLHQWMRSKHPFLRAIGRLHRYHHYFFSTSLKINKAFTFKNIIWQGIPEYMTQVIGSLFCLLFFNPIAIFIAIMIETYFFIEMLCVGGIDGNHRPLKRAKAYSIGVKVSPEYHALHHCYPQNYFGSELRLVDYILGTGCQIAKKRVALTGASGALGSCLKQLLEKEGAIVTPLKFGIDYDYSNYDGLTACLQNTDILVLSHGSKYDYAQQANCDSFVAIIELYKSLKKDILTPIEIWAVGSEIEFEPCFGDAKLLVYAQSKRNYAKIARTYFYDKNIQYRHIVPGGFTSSMGPGLMSAHFTAAITLFLIKRGFKYIPITYTGLAFFNYCRFLIARPL